jgi:hypothetical protein
MKLLVLLIAAVANLQVVNETGRTIDKLYIGEENRLSAKLPNHQSITVQIKPDRYDMTLTFDRAKITWTDFDLTTVFKITFQKVGNRINAHYEFKE